MIRYIQNDTTDPYWNLALEQYVFDALDKRCDYFLLWQNDNAVIVGKHQNTLGEINLSFVKEHGIRVARRLSGGGAVYHDMGNLNFTFITGNRGKSFDFSGFCRPVIRALASLGVNAEISGRNDMTIDGKKFSGNAQYSKKGRVMHHGTLLYDSNLQTLSQALRAPQDKLASKGVRSIRSRVTNIKPYMREDIPIGAFRDALRDFMFRENDMRWYALNEADLQAVQKLRDDPYAKWEWNYGASPACRIHKRRRVEGCGKIEAYLDVENGVIQKLAFFGDYFGNGDSTELAELLTGCPLKEEPLRHALRHMSLDSYFNNLSTDDFIDILLQ